MTAVICTEQVSITQDMNKAFYDIANIKIKLPFGGYVNGKGVYMAPYVRVGVIIALCVLILIFLMLRYTRFGRSLYAVGGNAQSAAMMGLNVKLIKMKDYIEKNRIYTDPDLKMSDLADHLGISSSKLSQVFNLYLKENWYDFINRYRLAEFKRLIAEGKDKQYTLLALSAKCGFKKSSFFTTFRKVEGMTPTEYLKEHK